MTKINMPNFSDYKEIAKEYYKLANLIEISDYAVERMIQILEAAQSDSDLNFIINEIDYIIAQKNNLLNQEDCFVDKLNLDESRSFYLFTKANKEENQEDIERLKPVTNSQKNRVINNRRNVQVGVYECEINLKFRLIEEKSFLRDREQLLQVLLEALVEGSDVFLEMLQQVVKVHQTTELKASPQMRRQLMHLRNSNEFMQTLCNNDARRKAK